MKLKIFSETNPDRLATTFNTFTENTKNLRIVKTEEKVSHLNHKSLYEIFVYYFLDREK